MKPLLKWKETVPPAGQTLHVFKMPVVGVDLVLVKGTVDTDSTQVGWIYSQTWEWHPQSFGCNPSPSLCLCLFHSLSSSWWHGGAVVVP